MNISPIKAVLTRRPRFLWTSLALDLILQQRSPNAMHKALTQLPGPLHDFYERLWHNVEDQGVEEVQRNKHVIALLLLAQRPVQRSVLEVIVSDLCWEEETATSEQWALSSNNFIEIDSQDMVHFSHHSVRVYLDSKIISEGLDMVMLARLLEQRLHGIKARDLQLLSETESAPSLDFEDDTASISSFSVSSFSSEIFSPSTLVFDPEDNRKKIFEPSTAEKQTGKERVPHLISRTAGS